MECNFISSHWEDICELNYLYNISNFSILSYSDIVIYTNTAYQPL